MDEYRRNVEMVQRAVYQDAAGIRPDPYLAQRVLHAAERERRVVGRRKRFALVLLAAALLIGTAAAAAKLLWRDYAPQMQQTERELGDYAAWPDERRIRLAKDLLVMGYVEENDAAKALLGTKVDEHTQAETADRMILELTGLDDVREVHSTLITYAVMGHEDTWTAEQRAWWNEILAAGGETEATDTLVVPGGREISETEAIAVARAAVQAAHGFDDAYMDALHPVASLYVTDERPDYRRWDVQFKKYKEGSDSYVEKVYSCVVDENGQVIADPETGIEQPETRSENTNGRPTTALFQLIDEYAQRADNSPFRTWSLEQKAEYSRVVAPQVREIVESGDLTPLNNGESPDLSVIASATYTYGLPDTTSLPQETARQLAAGAIMCEYGLSDEIMKCYGDISVYYDVTDEARPLWRFVFLPESFGAFPNGMNDERALLRYRAEIDARSGEVVSTEEFAFEILGKSLIYDLKFY